MRVGVIGIRRMGRAHLAACRKLDFVDEVVACDIDKSQEAWAREKGYPFYSSVAAMLESGIDAAMVVTPPVAHASNIRQCLEAGVPALTEKPMSTDVDEGQELVDLAERKGLQFQVGFELRYAGCVRGMKEIIASGLIGEVRYLSTIQLSGPHSGGYMVKERVGGIFYEKLCHQIDTYRYFLGEPERVMADACPSVLKQYTVADNVISRLQFPGGRAGNIMFLTSRAAQAGGTDDHGDRGHFYELIVTCSGGSVTYDPWTNSLEVVRFNHREDEKNELVDSIRNIRERWGDEVYNLDDQDADFLMCVRDGRPLTNPASDAQKTMEWVRRAELSLTRHGEWVGAEE
jgi:predicted dehydrogenase